MAQLAETADGLHPAETLFDQLTFSLTDRVRRMTCRARITLI
jgi:hypothetical protein